DLLAEDRYRVLLARGVAEKIGAQVGETMTMMAITRNGGLNAVDLEVVGIVTLGFRELDNMQVFLDLPTAMEFLDIDSVPLLITVLEKTEYTGAVKAAITQLFNSQAGQPLGVEAGDEPADYYQQVRGVYGTRLRVRGVVIMLGGAVAIINRTSMALCVDAR